MREGMSRASTSRLNEKSGERDLYLGMIFISAQVYIHHLMRMKMNLNLPPLIYGDALVDIFPDGQEMVGGCALNVAWHLRGLGLDPVLVSRVGDDAFGKKILKEMQAWGLSTDGIQLDLTEPTGKVEIYFDVAGEIRFKSPVQVASDFIDEGALRFTTGSGLLYYGSYAMRGARSAATLKQLFQSTLSRFVDLNLRPPHWTPEILITALQNADRVKVNEEELANIEWVMASEQMGQSGTIQSEQTGNFEDRVKKVMEKFNIRQCYLTLGERGALEVTHVFDAAFSMEEEYLNGADPIVDAVGAGDAFCAGIIFSLYRNLDQKTALKNACEFAAMTCSFRGATIASREFYARARVLWENDSKQ